MRAPQGCLRSWLPLDESLARPACGAGSCARTTLYTRASELTSSRPVRLFTCQRTRLLSYASFSSKFREESSANVAGNFRYRRRVIRTPAAGRRMLASVESLSTAVENFPRTAHLRSETRDVRRRPTLRPLGERAACHGVAKIATGDRRIHSRRSSGTAASAGRMVGATDDAADYAVRSAVCQAASRRFS